MYCTFYRSVRARIMKMELTTTTSIITYKINKIYIRRNMTMMTVMETTTTTMYKMRKMYALRNTRIVNAMGNMHPKSPQILTNVRKLPKKLEPPLRSQQQFHRRHILPLKRLLKSCRKDLRS